MIERDASAHRGLLVGRPADLDAASSHASSTGVPSTARSPLPTACAVSLSDTLRTTCGLSQEISMQERLRARSLKSCRTALFAEPPITTVTNRWNHPVLRRVWTADDRASHPDRLARDMFTPRDHRRLRADRAVVT